MKRPDSSTCALGTPTISPRHPASAAGASVTLTREKSDGASMREPLNSSLPVTVSPGCSVSSTLVCGVPSTEMSVVAQ